ncbi:pathway-specific nitrogen regulator protein [Rutstroemia sp. NJR-2017a BBW]|nr:pathway-specific nitrogen regulator protein [Rutstroemia sp. NJR-2017a BBW]
MQDKRSPTKSNELSQWNLCPATETNSLCKQRGTTTREEKEDNGHECMGYADGPEALTMKKDTRSPEGNVGEYDEGQYTHMQSVRSDSRDTVQHQHQKRVRHDAIMSSMPGMDTKLEDTGGGQSHFNKHGPGSESVTAAGEGLKGRMDYRDATVFSDEGPSPLERDAPLHNDEPVVESHRVPYFRYFGPTAIVPGFKQMVVSVREHRRSMGASSATAMSPGSAKYGSTGSAHAGTPSQSGTETRSSIDMPIYEPNDPLPVNRLIIHLVEVFFAHLGCNYPFLSKRQGTFKRLVEEKKVEPILVDAVCALAARFSDHPLLTTSHEQPHPKSDYGQVFAQRAKAAVVDTFPCPTVGAVQACLLLAYEGFGANQDSALWMYLGCAIRMAVDLGLQKLDGVKHQGQKDPGYHRSTNERQSDDLPASITVEEKTEIEEERIDTLWAVLMLDRVISSGTGRPVSLKDEDLELTLPAAGANSDDVWPDPFPALIRIIHLYGRVSDLLNHIRGVKDVTPILIQQLSGMERDLTQLYQRLDQRLNFNAPNFQHYVKSGEGTNFILMHFWFHTLIMLLHQPTLMHSFEGQILQLLPNSRELSMSSAKTIADILAFAELIDPRSFIGNPFTSQPIYIAACAFLKETALHTSQPTSRDTSPPKQSSRGPPEKPKSIPQNHGNHKPKHSLLAAAATQNYQRCYKALQQLETYWAGARYILVALDQKQSGIDPQEVETYTMEEYTEAIKAREMIPHWRRKFPQNSPRRFAEFVRSPRLESLPGSPAIDASHAIGWSLTGTTNSPSSNLTFMYQSNLDNQAQAPPLPHGGGNMIYDPIRQSLPETTMGSTSTSNHHPRYSQYTHSTPRRSSHQMPPPAPKFITTTPDSPSAADAEMLLGLTNSPYQKPSPFDSHGHSHNHNLSSSPRSYDFAGSPSAGGVYNGNGNGNGYTGLGGNQVVGDMMMESQDIDMSTLGEDMMPWLEYLPPDMLGFFEGTGNSGEGG